MIAFTREPSGRRASTIGDASSTRRPIRRDDLVDDPQEVLVVDERGLGLDDLAASLDVDVVEPFTMISVMVSSRRNGSSGP